MRSLVLLTLILAWTEAVRAEPVGIVPSSERAAFQQWFTFLAESQYFNPAAKRPAEITDCAALVRFAYREALRVHDAAWTQRVSLPKLPALRPFPTRAIDPRYSLGNGALGHFADAKTLRQHNTRFIGHNVAQAQPGDLLFYRQDSQKMPFHVMVFIGRSHFDKGSVVVYHTGPTYAGSTVRDPGEIRRLTLSELANHPEPRWRPTTANAHFLGIYRWNLLAGGGQE
jgi:uncharacterized protein YfaT (DUF1175 family)